MHYNALLEKMRYTAFSFNELPPIDKSSYKFCSMRLL